ncbi:MAG TPA: hydantoinase/oxoprolinase family protein [Xanthobacteraceae bacterium]|jgi:N-methylhydantoinase A|nr:hydantoinase/oxoprolinase family protein [Xanthobacteraceae bacterium]
MTQKGIFRLAVDIGGTFTDVVLQTPDGAVSGKVLTTPDAPENGVINGINGLLRKAGVAPSAIEHTIHGTTLATNAIIERRGAVTALLTTQGFKDTLEFAFGHRFDQYDLEMQRPEALVSRPWRLEVPERMAADGSVLLPLDDGAVRTLCRRIQDAGIESVAVSFLHSYRNADHELRVRDILAEEIPDLYISLSHEVCPEIREYDRTSTTVANAYVQPKMAGYLNKLREGLAGIGLTSPLLMIMSAGSLTSVETAIRFPIRLVESGPAGGAILGQHIAKELGARQAIAFDMGGTTAKIILLNDYEPRHSRAMEVARIYRFLPGSGLPLRIPVIDMIEIGAGGGSIAQVDALTRITVGPESASAAPGPACYGLGGKRPTVTDADLVLGKLDPNAFAGGTMTLDDGAARSAIDSIVAQPSGIDVPSAAAGMIEIVDENMANATRVHAADNGDQVETRVLIATGGAAPLHAARIAQKLGIETVVVPEGAGVGSAHGFLRAPIAYEAVRSTLVSLDRFDAAAINAIFADLRKEAEAVLRLAGEHTGYTERRMSDMRYRGQGHDLSVELPARDYTDADAPLFEELFHAQYRKNYSRTIPNLKVQALTWTLVLSHAREDAAEFVVETASSGAAAPVAGRRNVFDAELGRFVDAAIVRRDTAEPGMTFAGPAVIVEDQTTTYVPSEFTGHVSAHNHLVLTRRVTA